MRGQISEIRAEREMVFRPWEFSNHALAVFLVKIDDRDSRASGS